MAALSPIAAGAGLGLALGAAPGPVQVVVLGETLRGGFRRGVRAVAGANLSFASLLLALAAGVNFLNPSGVTLRAVEAAGGAFLFWLGAGALRQSGEIDASHHASTLPPAARGALAVFFNPGGWIFLATAGTSLLSAAAHAGGQGSAVEASLALTAGLAIGDLAIVFVAAAGLKRASSTVRIWTRRGLALLLVVLGVGLLARAAVGA